MNGTFSSWDSNNNGVFAEYAWGGNYDAVDFKPDVYVGRLACNNENEVDVCVQKIITYETSQAWSQEWFTTVVCVGGDSLPGDADNIDEGEYVQQHVIDILEGFIPQRIWASNGNLRTSSAINEAINTGAGFVFFNGHGLNDIWATHPHNSNVWIPMILMHWKMTTSCLLLFQMRVIMANMTSLMIVLRGLLSEIHMVEQLRSLVALIQISRTLVKQLFRKESNDYV